MNIYVRGQKTINKFWKFTKIKNKRLLDCRVNLKPIKLKKRKESKVSHLIMTWKDKLLNVET